MAIRTITIIQGHYTALQGYWNWDKSTGFNFISVPPSDHFVLQYTTRNNNNNSSSCLTLVPFNTPSTTPTGNIDCVSIVDDDDSSNCLDDDPDHSLDNSLLSIDFDPPSRYNSTQSTYGLGISGLLKKDGSGPFTGLGIVFSVRSSFSWREATTQGFMGLDLDCGKADGESNSWNISDTILQETLRTFDEDFVYRQLFKSIPERELSLQNIELSSSLQPKFIPPNPSSNSKPVPPPVANTSYSPTSAQPPSPTRKTKFTFALPTISSQLKKISNKNQNITFLVRKRCNSSPVSSSGSSCSAKKAMSGMEVVRKRRSVSSPLPSRSGNDKTVEKDAYIRLRR